MRKFFIAAAVAVISLIGSGSTAQATFQVTLHETGFSDMVIAGSDFAAINYTGDFGDFSLKVLGSSSDNGLFGGSFSDLLSSTTSVTNNSTGQKTLTITVSQTDYTQPSSTLLAIESGLSGTVNAGGISLANIFQAYADAGNNLNGTSDFTNGPQTGVASGSTFDTGSALGTFTRSGNYSLTQVITLTMDGQSIVNFSAHENVHATPAPAGLVLALTGMPMLGLGAWVRRRRLATAA